MDGAFRGDAETDGRALRVDDTITSPQQEKNARQSKGKPPPPTTPTGVLQSGVRLMQIHFAAPRLRMPSCIHEKMDLLTGPFTLQPHGLERHGCFA